MNVNNARSEEEEQYLEGYVKGWNACLEKVRQVLNSRCREEVNRP